MAVSRSPRSASSRRTPIRVSRSISGSRGHPPSARPDGWAYTSPPLRALDLGFGVGTDDTAIGRFLDDTLGELRADGPVPCWYSIVREGSRWVLRCGSEPVVRSRTASYAIAMFFWHLNAAVVAASSRHVLVHAASAASDGRSVILSGPSGSGKTTLVASLVEAGLDYLSDEIAALEPDEGLIRAYPKPLAIEPGTWRLLPHLQPPRDPALDVRLPATWFVPADRIRAGSVVASARPHLVVDVRFDAAADTTVRSVERGEMLARLARNTFGCDGRQLGALAAMLSRCRCYELSYPTLADGSRTVLGLL